MPRRRQYLQAIATGTAAVVAGCSGTDDGSGTEPSTATDTEATATDAKSTDSERNTSSDRETETADENPFEPPTTADGDSEGPIGPPGLPGTPQGTTETATPTEEG